jgi:predicted CoA-binding protein
MPSQPDLEPFASARCLAFVGVSIATDCPTRKLFRALVARGHVVIPIRPGVSEIEGVKAYANVELAGTVDGVVIMASRRHAARALEHCHVAEVPRVWLIGDDASGAARAYAARCAMPLVVLHDPIAASDQKPSMVHRITGRLRRITSITRLTVADDLKRPSKRPSTRAGLAMDRRA